MRTTDKKKLLLPSEYLGSVTDHPDTTRALRRARPVLFIVWVLPLAAYVWRGVRVGDWGLSLIGVAFSAGIGYKLWQAMVTGYTCNNHGEFLRAARPFGYWLSVVFLVLGYLMGIAALLFAPYATKA